MPSTYTNANVAMLWLSVVFHSFAMLASFVVAFGDDMAEDVPLFVSSVLSVPES